MKNIHNAKLCVTMLDGSEWNIPVKIIAESRANYYKDEFGGDIDRSLKEDTWPVFEDDDYEITDWAANNMNWADVKEFAVMVEPPEPVDNQEGWINGEKEIVYDKEKN